MKNILIAILVLGVLIGGYYLITKKPSNTTDTSSYGKLNIDVVCRNALSYMSFPDGASADLFVTDCKEGKYPDVIERYKAEMNLGEGAAI